MRTKVIRRNYELTHLSSESEKDTSWLNAMAAKYKREYNVASAQRTEMQELYDAAEGKADMDSYSHATNPYNTENANYQRFPAKLRNYDIIRPIIDTFLGETTEMSYGASVTVGNPDAQNKRKIEKSDALAGQLAQDFINHLNAMGVETGVASQEIPPYAEAAKNFDESYDDKRAIFGQGALDYIRHNVNLDLKILELIYDWVAVGRLFTFKEVDDEDVTYNVEDPRDIVVIGWGESSYAEDAEAVVKAVRVTGSEILAKFHQEIMEHEQKDEILTIIDSMMIEDRTFGEFTSLTSDQFLTNRDKDDTRILEKGGTATLYHIVFSSINKVYILHYFSPLGEREQMFVDSSYKLDKANGDIELEGLIIREWYENYSVDDLFYIKGKKGDCQRHLLNNLASCKLPYNGTYYGFRQSEINSKVKQLMPFQILYNIFHYRWELLLAKNKDKIMLLPQGLIPNKKGWDEDKFFYYMEALGFAIYDETAPNATAILQGLKAIDLSVGTALEKMWGNLMAIKQEAWDVIGWNRQRAGETFASDGKGANAQAEARSSIITAALYFQFNKFLEMDYKGLLDLSKFAFADGKKTSYVNSEGKTVWFALEGDDIIQFMESEFNIFALNTVFEKGKLQKAEQLILTMGQNGLPPDAMLEVLDATNFSKMKRLVKQGMAAEKEFEQSLKQMDGQTAQMQSEALKAVQDSKNATDIQVAQIQANAKIKVANSTGDLLNGMMEDTADMEQSANPVDIASVQNNIAKKEADIQKSNMANDNAQLKREDIAAKKEIAKMNRNRYDK